jgi:hypothetical protein
LVTSQDLEGVRLQPCQRCWLLPATVYILEHLTPSGAATYRTTVSQLYSLSEEARILAEKIKRR